MTIYSIYDNLLTDIPLDYKSRKTVSKIVSIKNHSDETDFMMCGRKAIFYYWSFIENQK